jgi:hypothetical protein
VGLGFVEAGVEGAQGAGEGGNGGVKQGWVHSSLRWGVTSSHILDWLLKVRISRRFCYRLECVVIDIISWSQFLI